MMHILDYTKPLCDISAEVHQKVLWPCYEFSVQITGLPSFSGNAFENLILKLLALGNRDFEQIEKDTGLKIDFIRFICDRLIERGFLKRDLSLTDQGRTKIERSHNPEPQNCCVYLDGVSGKFMPFVEYAEERNPLTYRNSRIENGKFSCKPVNFSAGNESLLSRSMRIFQEKFSVEKDKERDIFFLKGTKETKEEIDIQKGIQGILNSSKIVSQKGVCTIKLNDQSVPKKVYRIIDVVLQKGNTRDFFASDGKGNISPFFTGALNNMSEDDEKYIISLRKQIEKEINESEKNKRPESQIEKDPLLFSLNQKIGGIEKAKNIIEKKNTSGKSTNDEKAIVKAKVDFSHGVYAFAECLIYRLCCKSELPIDAGFEKLKQIAGNQENNKNLVKQFLIHEAKRVGFEIPPEIENDFAIPFGTIYYRLQREKSPEMFSICALALALSSETTPEQKDFWLCEIAARHPDFFVKISKMKQNRNHAIHENKVEVTTDELFEFYDFIKGVFTPYFDFSRSDKQYSIIDKIKDESETNKAIAQMEEDLGFALKHSLPRNLFLIVEEVERYSLDTKRICQIVLHLYQLFEVSFQILRRSLSKTNKADFRKKYKIAWSGHQGEGFKTAEQFFASVNKKDVESEINGKYKSLRAGFAAWLCMEEIVVLKNWAHRFPDLLEAVSKIADMRGHGEIPDDKTICNVCDIEAENLTVEQRKGKITDVLLGYKKLGIEVLRFMASENCFG